MTWVRYANRLEEENNGLKKLLEEALGHIDQYDYEESFDLVQRIKDALGSKPLKAVQWGDNAVTEAEELLQKVQQLEREISVLEEAFAKADVVAGNTRSDGRREWQTIECWVYPGEVIVQMDRAALDAARAKEAKP